MALAGAFERLKSAYADKVTLDVASMPKKIVVLGSKSDLCIAKTIFYGDGFDYADDPPSQDSTCPAEICALCWTEPQDSLKMSCTHIYCRDCFLHQTRSVGEKDIPLRCCGDSARCTHVRSSNLIPF